MEDREALALAPLILLKLLLQAAPIPPTSSTPAPDTDRTPNPRTTGHLSPLCTTDLFFSPFHLPRIAPLPAPRLLTSAVATSSSRATTPTPMLQASPLALHSSSHHALHFQAATLPDSNCPDEHTHRQSATIPYNRQFLPSSIPGGAAAISQFRDLLGQSQLSWAFRPNCL